jgi:hypothetical protein
MPKSSFVGTCCAPLPVVILVGVGSQVGSVAWRELSMTIDNHYDFDFGVCMLAL